MTVPQSRKLNNKGMSVVELLIIIAIIAVLMSGAIVSFTVLNGSNIKQATRTCKSYMEKTRTNAMSVVADEWYFELKNVSGEYIASVFQVLSDDEGNVNTTLVEEKNLGMKIAMTLISDDTEVAISDGQVLKVNFNPSSGSINAVSLDGVKYTPDSNMVTLHYEVGAKENWLDLYFMSGNIEIR